MMRTVLKILLPLLLICLSISTAQAQGDQIIYSDALANGWEDWSWSQRDLNATEYVHSGNRSARITYTAPWQGFYLHHSAFDTSNFTEIIFWVHGGTVNGRNIRVQALLNDIAQASVPLNSYIQGGSIIAGQWRKVTIPLSALGVAGQSNMTGFWLMDGIGSTQPA